MQGKGSAIQSGDIQQEQWERAAQYLVQFGALSSNVAATIRTLRVANAATAARGVFDSTSHFELVRFLRAPAFKVPIYFLAKTRFDDELNQKEYIGAPDLMGLFTAHELASIIGLVFMYRRLQSRIRGRDAEEWARAAKVIEEQIAIGMLLGETIKQIGIANAMLISGMRAIAATIFALKNQKLFKEYRRDLKIKDRIFDTADECKRWDCSSIDLAARLLVTAGYGRPFAEAYHIGMSSEPSGKLTDAAIQARIIGLWSEALHLGASPPTIQGEEKFQAPPDELDRLYERCTDIRQAGIQHPWLAQSKKEVSKESHPQLFRPVSE